MEHNLRNIFMTGEEMRRHLTEKSFVDTEFRNLLLTDPKRIIKQEFDIDIPDNIEIKVHENDMQTLHLALPMSTDLDEEQLEHISAGVCDCLGC